MKFLIKKLCKQIERENKLKILFAVENGSRAWRLSSKDSDYDVRFVFVRPLEDYLMLNKKSDVINIAFDKNGEKTKVEGSFIDFSGFDVFKFCRLLISSNPTTIEWLNSDIVYYGKQNKIFKDFSIKSFEVATLYYHYMSMCRENYLKYLKSKKEVTYKKYLYAMRGLVNAEWVKTKRSIPPISFIETVNNIGNQIPEHIKNKLNEVILLKAESQEKDIIQNIVKIDDFIENFLKDKPNIKESKIINTDALDEEIKKIVLKA